MNEEKAEKKERTVHRYPYLAAVIVVSVLAVIAQILIIVDCFVSIVQYEVEAVSSVMSTCAEVIAGLYGITLTGYIFFSDRFRDTPKDDESLYDAVQALLLRYNHMAGFISLMCLVCIMLAEGIVLYGTNTVLPAVAYRFWINETLLLCFGTYNLILYFVISVLDPQKVKRISNQKKAKLSEDTATGDAEEFLSAWTEIQNDLLSRRENLMSTMRFVPQGGKGRPQLVNTLEMLRNYGKISPNQWRKLEKLRQYYNLHIHDVNQEVSLEMCNLAKDVLNELQGRP